MSALDALTDRGWLADRRRRADVGETTEMSITTDAVAEVVSAPEALPAAEAVSTAETVASPESEAPEADTPAAQARLLARYLLRVRRLLRETMASRRSWLRQIGILIQDARFKPAGMVAPIVARVGHEQAAIFMAMRDRLSALRMPFECLTLHATTLGWFDKQVVACDVLVRIGTAGDLSRLREAQHALADGREDSERMEIELKRMVSVLRNRIAEQRAYRQTKKVIRQSRIRWPFRR